MIDVEHIKKAVEVKKRENILLKHNYKIWEGKDGCFRTYLSDPNGRKLIKRKTLRKLEDVLIAYYSERDSLPKTFRDVYWEWRAVQDLLVESANTPVKYDTDYTRYFENAGFSDKPIDILTLDDVKVFIVQTTRKHQLCKKAIKTLFGYIDRVIQFAVTHKYISENILQYVAAKDFYKYATPSKRSQKTQVFSPTDLKLLRKQLMEDHQAQPGYIPSYAVELAILTGMRVGELAALKWDHINEDGILIDQSEKYNRQEKKYFIDKTKNKKDRFFPMTSEIQGILKAVKRAEIENGYLTEWVFSNGSGRVHAPVISSCIKTKCRQIGIEEHGIHALRKTLNSQFRHDGVPVTVASSLLGHTEAVNDSYYTFDISDLSEKTEIVQKANKKIWQIG